MNAHKKPKKEAKVMKKRKTAIGCPPFLRIDSNASNVSISTLSQKNLKIRRAFALLIIISLFVPAIYQLQGQVEAEPTFLEPDTGPHTGIWTFDNPKDFNTTETKIDSSAVQLQMHEYRWNQSTQDDFNSGQRINVTITQSSYSTVIWSDDFEYEGDDGWERFILGGGLNEWEHGNISKIPKFIGTHNSGIYVWGTKLNGTYDDSTGEPSDYYLKSPSIDLSDSVNTKLTFWHYYTFDNETVYNDGGRMEVSIDGGFTWIPKFPITGYPGQIQSGTNELAGESCFVGNSSKWIQETFDLSSHDGLGSLIIRFRFATDGQESDYGWYIDDIEITSNTFSDGEVELRSRSVEVGTEAANIIQRPSGETIIDTNNPVNVDGLLTKWKVNIKSVTSPAFGKMKIFREQASEFIFINETDLVEILEGSNDFTCNIPVRVGDYIGWYAENASIYAKSEGKAYSISGDINEENIDDFKWKSNWTDINYTFSIRAWGISRVPKGTFTSRIFDAGSPAIWYNISWVEYNMQPGVDIVFRTRTGNSTNPEDGSWSSWSPELSNPAHSIVRSPNSRYIQFQVTLTTTKQPYTPLLLSVSLNYRKYYPSGEVETNDLIPKFVVQWQNFFVDETLSGQKIDYFYSLDSGSSWHAVPGDHDFREKSVLTGKIRFRLNLITNDTTRTPTNRQMSITYSVDRPEMGLFIETEKKTAKPGETLSYRIYFNNTGFGMAKDVTITLELDNNLTYIEDNNDVSSIIEGGNKVKWYYDTVEVTISGNKLFDVHAKVKSDLEKETTVTVRAVINYTDIGGNQYNNVFSNLITIEIRITKDMSAYYLSLGAIITAILIVAFALIYTRYRALKESEINIGVGDVDRGIGYLVMEENPTISYGIFSDLIDLGYKGLCITRTFPSRVKASYYFEGVSILWLSRTRGKDSMLPTNLSGVLNYVKDFMEGNENPVILLDGLEYLMVHNDFQKVLKMVHGLNELSAIYNAMLLIPLNPLTMDVDKIALLKRDLKILG